MYSKSLKTKLKIIQYPKDKTTISELQKEWDAFKKNSGKIYRPLKRELALLKKAHPTFREPRFKFSTTMSRKDILKPFESFHMPTRGTIFKFRTSGTSGTPAEIYFSPLAYYSRLFLSIPKALWIYDKSFEFNPGQSLSVFLTDNPESGFIQYQNLVPGFPNVTVLPIKQTQGQYDWKSIFDDIAKLNPKVLCSKPNIFFLMMEGLKELNTKEKAGLKFEKFLSSGAMLSVDLKNSLESAFCRPVMNTYMTSELGFIGSSCRFNRIHLDSERVYLETKNGKLLGTYLKNPCLPLWKYEIGDQGIISKTSCRCGRVGTSITSLKGRSPIFFDGISGEKISSTIFMDIFHKNRGLNEFTLTQKSIKNFEFKFEAHGLKETSIKDYLENKLPCHEFALVPVIQFDKNKKHSRFRKETF